MDKYDATINGIDDQRTLTPFQRQVITAAEAWEAEQQEEKRKEQQQQYQQSSGPPRNSRAGASPSSNSMGQEETVRYVNKQEYPDHPVHDE